MPGLAAIDGLTAVSGQRGVDQVLRQPDGAFLRLFPPPYCLDVVAGPLPDDDEPEPARPGTGPREVALEASPGWSQIFSRFSPASGAEDG